MNTDAAKKQQAEARKYRQQDAEIRRESQAGRLKQAREREYGTASEAARALGVAQPTYLAHENGIRGFNNKLADIYARHLGVDTAWLILGEGKMDRAGGKEPTTGVWQPGTGVLDVNPLTANLDVSLLPNGTYAVNSSKQDSAERVYKLPRFRDSRNYVVELALLDGAVQNEDRQISLPHCEDSFLFKNFARAPHLDQSDGYVFYFRTRDGDLFPINSFLFVNPTGPKINQTGYYCIKRKGILASAYIVVDDDDFLGEGEQPLKVIFSPTGEMRNVSKEQAEAITIGQINAVFQPLSPLPDTPFAHLKM